MSEQELNAILEEIKNKGKIEAEAEESIIEDINFAFNSAASRKSRRERLEEETEVSPTEEDEVAPKKKGYDGGKLLEEEAVISDQIVVDSNEKADENKFFIDNEPEFKFKTADDEKKEKTDVEDDDVISFKIDVDDELDADKAANNQESDKVNSFDVSDSIEQEPIILKEEPILVENNADNQANNEEDDDLSNEDEEIPIKDKGKKSNKKGIIIGAIVALVLVVAAVAAFAIAKNMNKVEPPTTNPPATEVGASDVTTPVVKNSTKNPLTGEDGYNKNAIGKRPVAVVVENEYSTESVRPQWGLADADIVLEGESEYSTRMLLFWADYTTVPEQVGPARSARPPFIRFSQLFDAVFIHAGLSHSKGNYVGADSVFENDNVDHINLLHTAEDGKYFGRDKSKTSTIEHTGFLNGTNVEDMLNHYNIPTDFTPESYTQLSFNDEVTDLSTTPAKSIQFRWGAVGKGRCPKTGTYSYDEASGKYTTTDFDSQYGTADVKWQNLVFLLDQTSYIEKSNYKGGSSSEIYCDYSLSGGKGVIASNGTAVEITWGVENGKLWMKDSAGNEVKLNPGKTYIGYGSENYGGSFTINE